ncbi:hypothetical protein SALBM135S_01707 [Streptomyces alboniger]
MYSVPAASARMPPSAQTGQAAASAAAPRPLEALPLALLGEVVEEGVGVGVVGLADVSERGRPEENATK